MQATHHSSSSVSPSRFSAGAIVMFAAAMSLTGCEALPGDSKSQGTVIGGASGAAAGAIIGGEDNRLLGAIIGTVIGAGGGYVIGNELEKSEAREAAAKGGKTGSFTVEDVHRSNTADLDADGNVTIAELVALDRAGLRDVEIIRRAESTNVVFDLSEEQRTTLRESGVSPMVIDWLTTINRPGDRVGAPR